MSLPLLDRENNCTKCSRPSQSRFCVVKNEKSQPLTSGLWVSIKGQVLRHWIRTISQNLHNRHAQAILVFFHGTSATGSKEKLFCDDIDADADKRHI